LCYVFEGWLLGMERKLSFRTLLSALITSLPEQAESPFKGRQKMVGSNRCGFITSHSGTLRLSSIKKNAVVLGRRTEKAFRAIMIDIAGWTSRLPDRKIGQLASVSPRRRAPNAAQECRGQPRRSISFTEFAVLTRLRRPRRPIRLRSAQLLLSFQLNSTASGDLTDTIATWQGARP
jgi:hypothetical protein